MEQLNQYNHYLCLKSLEFPSIVEQIEKRFSARVALYMAILEVLGYKKGEINDIFNRIFAFRRMS
jgi:hypothetical protein